MCVLGGALLYAAFMLLNYNTYLLLHALCPIFLYFLSDVIQFKDNSNTFEYTTNVNIAMVIYLQYSLACCDCCVEHGRLTR